MTGVQTCALPIYIDSSSNIAPHYEYSNYNNIESIGTNYIYAIYQDTNNRIWFAMGEKGLNVLENGKVVHYGKENGLLDDRIF